METRTMGYARAVIREKTIPYRPRYTQITGRVTASILLQQVVYYWEMHQRPFYKFREPCSHDLYEEGDSWTECLGFSGAEFDTAIKTIGTKLLKNTSKNEILRGDKVENLVIYWTDSGRVTWYELNVPLFDRLTAPLYEDPNSRNSDYLIQESGITESKNPELPIPEIPEIPKRLPPDGAREPINVSRVLRRATRTRGENDPIEMSPLAEYISQQIGQNLSPGQCNKLTEGYTEQLLGGKQRKHPPPDKLWTSHPLFPEYVAGRIEWAIKEGGSPATQRRMAIGIICRYKGGHYTWLEWLKRKTGAVGAGETTHTPLPPGAPEVPIPTAEETEELIRWVEEETAGLPPPDFTRGKETE